MCLVPVPCIIIIILLGETVQILLSEFHHHSLMWYIILHMSENYLIFPFFMLSKCILSHQVPLVIKIFLSHPPATLQRKNSFV